METQVATSRIRVLLSSNPHLPCPSHRLSSPSSLCSVPMGSLTRPYQELRGLPSPGTQPKVLPPARHPGPWLRSQAALAQSPLLFPWHPHPSSPALCCTLHTLVPTQRLVCCQLTQVPRNWHHPGSGCWAGPGLGECGRVFESHQERGRHIAGPGHCERPRQGGRSSHPASGHWAGSTSYTDARGLPMPLQGPSDRMKGVRGAPGRCWDLTATPPAPRVQPQSCSAYRRARGSSCWPRRLSGL